MAAPPIRSLKSVRVSGRTASAHQKEPARISDGIWLRNLRTSGSRYASTTSAWHAGSAIFFERVDLREDATSRETNKPRSLRDVILGKIRLCALDWQQSPGAFGKRTPNGGFAPLVAQVTLMAHVGNRQARPSDTKWKRRLWAEKCSIRRGTAHNNRHSRSRPCHSRS